MLESTSYEMIVIMELMKMLERGKLKVHEYMCEKLGLRVDNSNEGVLELQKVLANAAEESVWY